MKANINIQINVPNDFECGQYEKCPLACKSYFENHYVDDIRDVTEYSAYPVSDKETENEERN